MSCHGKVRKQGEVVRIHHGDFGWIAASLAAVAHKQQVMRIVIDHVVGIV